MSQEPLIELGLDKYLALFAVATIVVLVMYWLLQRRDTQTRESFLAQFDAADLRMSPYKIGMVYRVVSATETEVMVVPVWDGKASVTGSAEVTLPHSAVMPFDESRFF